MTDDKDTPTRTQGEVVRCTLPFEIVTAGEQEDGSFRVTGYMNTFKVMHSKRFLHPRGFESWLKRTGGGAPLPMLANHGYAVVGFASIGQWDRFEFHEGRGMLWSGSVGKGTQLTDDARALLKQRLLRQLSVGAVVRQSRFISLKDADIDPVIRKAMEEAEVDEIRAALDWYPVEGSVVDVADDSGARIAAKMQEEMVAPLAKEIAKLDARMQKLAASELNEGLIVELLAALSDMKSQFAERSSDRAGLEGGSNAVQSGIEELIDQARTGLDEIKTDLQRWLEEARADVDNLKADLQAAWEADHFDELADDVEATDLSDGEADAPQGQKSATEVNGLIERVRKIGS